MGDSWKLMITQESRFSYPQNQAALLSNQTIRQKHETCSQTIEQWWHEAHILPSELSKLMNPYDMLSAHINNNHNIFYGKVTFQSEGPSLYLDLK